MNRQQTDEKMQIRAGANGHTLLAMTSCRNTPT